MTRSDDSDPPPFDDESTPEDLETLTPPPTSPDQLLRWHTRKLTNKLTEIVERVNHIGSMPRDHEKRIRTLENQRVDKDLIALGARLDDTEDTVKAHGTNIDDLKQFKWKAIGMMAAGTALGSIVASVLVYIITRSL